MQRSSAEIKSKQVTPDAAFQSEGKIFVEGSNRDVLILSTQEVQKPKNENNIGAGHTGLAMRAATDGTFAVMRSAENLQSGIPKNSISSGGWLVITGHGAEGIDFIGGSYTTQIDELKSDIKRNPKEFVDAAKLAGLKSGDSINIALGICYATSQPQGYGSSFAEKLAEAFALEGISTRIIGSKNVVHRLDENDMKAHSAQLGVPGVKLGAKIEDLVIFERKAQEKKTLLIPNKPQPLFLTNKGIGSPSELGFADYAQEDGLIYFTRPSRDNQSRTLVAEYQHEIFKFTYHETVDGIVANNQDKKPIKYKNVAEWMEKEVKKILPELLEKRINNNDSPKDKTSSINKEKYNELFDLINKRVNDIQLSGELANYYFDNSKNPSEEIKNKLYQCRAFDLMDLKCALEIFRINDTGREDSKSELEHLVGWAEKSSSFSSQKTAQLQKEFAEHKNRILTAIDASKNRGSDKNGDKYDNITTLIGKLDEIEKKLRTTQKFTSMNDIRNELKGDVDRLIQSAKQAQKGPFKSKVAIKLEKIAQEKPDSPPKTPRR